MTVTVDETTELFIRQAVERGTFTNPEEAVACAVSHLAEADAEAWLLRNRDAVRSALEESLAAESRGESFSPEEVFRMLKENREQRRITQAA